MITKAERETINTYTNGSGRVLSVYLDVDQSNTANLNRKFEAAFEAHIKELGRSFEEEYEERDFDKCVDDARKRLAAYQPHGRGLVMFIRSAGSSWVRELNVPVITELYWGPHAHVKQFVEAMDEFESYGVVLTDHSHTRVFTLRLGALERHAEIYALQGVRHLKTTGMDHLYSQSHLQRKADEHAASHMKRVVEVVELLAKTHPFDRLVLAGSTQAASELFHLFPKTMRRKVVACATLAANAPENRIVEEISSVARKTERQGEIEKATNLITAAAKHHHAVTGLTETLEALNEKRVRELLYSDGFILRGGVCDSCKAVFANDTMNCEFCGMPVKPADDLIEAAIGMALAEGAGIEQVRGEGAEMLNAAGGIGATLRY